jgi:hypothetical protein
MRKTIQILIFTVLVALVSPITSVSAAECRSSTQTNCTVTLRDSRGVKTGTIEQGNNGTSTVRDSRGVKTGTVTPQGSKNCVVIRDSRGVKIGTRGC